MGNNKPESQESRSESGLGKQPLSILQGRVWVASESARTRSMEQQRAILSLSAVLAVCLKAFAFIFLNNVMLHQPLINTHVVCHPNMHMLIMSLYCVCSERLVLLFREVHIVHVAPLHMPWESGIPPQINTCGLPCYTLHARGVALSKTLLYCACSKHGFLIDRTDAILVQSCFPHLPRKGLGILLWWAGSQGRV